MLQRKLQKPVAVYLVRKEKNSNLDLNVNRVLNLPAILALLTAQSGENIQQ